MPVKEKEVVPDFSELASAIGSGLGLVFGSPELGSALSGIGSAVGGLFNEDPPEPRFPITEKAGVASHREFSWYLRSKETEQQEGTHAGAVFLQMSRQITRMTIKGHLAVDWDGAENEVDDINITLDVHQPEVPKTPIISDFTSTAGIPLMVPRTDVKTLLGIEDAELTSLIAAGDLTAFGNDQQITKGSLTNLLGL